MNDDSYARGLEEIRLLRARLARLEEAATAAAQAPPADAPSFGDAIRQLRETGTASGPAISELRRQIEEGPTPATAPTPEALDAATRVVMAPTGSDSIEAAYQRMEETAERRNVVENIQAGASGHVDVLDPATATAIDRLRKALEEGH